MIIGRYENDDCGKIIIRSMANMENKLELRKIQNRNIKNYHRTNSNSEKYKLHQIVNKKIKFRANYYSVKWTSVK